MTPMKAAAIALTLIIACPIILGYALASETTDTEIDVTEDGGSLSELILNSETEYYIDNSSPNNNSMLRYSVSAQGAVETSIKSPDYVSITDTYTSIPTYTSSSGTLSVDSISSTTYDYSAYEGTYKGIQSADGLDDALDTVTTYDAFTVTVTPTGENTTIMVQLIANGNYYIKSGTSVVFTFTKATDTTWRVTSGNTDVTTSYFMIGSDQAPNIVVAGRNFTTIDIDSTSWVITMQRVGVAKIVDSNGSNYIRFDSDYSSLTYANGIVVFGDTTYTGVTSIELALYNGSNTLYYTASGIFDGYAQPDQGWKIPTNENPYYAEWMNGYSNGYVRMCIYIPDDEYCVLTPIKASNTDTGVTLHNDGGTLRVSCDGTTYQTLGQYSRVLVEFEKDTITVSGITTWGSMSSRPTTYASIELEQSYDEDVIRIQLQSNYNGSELVQYRVDMSRIVGGTFPSTKDYTLKLYDLYPSDAHQTIVINSVGVYGDYLIINDTQYTVTNGNITITDSDGSHAVAIKDLEISYTNDNGTYTTTVNGYEVSTPSTPSLTFGGEWSVMINRGVVSTEVLSETHWQPNEFALDKDGFILAMFLTAGAAFVVLGMTGARSGAKVGLLALICGGACVVGFMLI